MYTSIMFVLLYMYVCASRYFVHVIGWHCHGDDPQRCGILKVGPNFELVKIKNVTKLCTFYGKTLSLLSNKNGRFAPLKMQTKEKKA